MTNRIFFVVDVDHDFKGNMSEAAGWLEMHLDNGSNFITEVTAYRSISDLMFDANDKEGAFKNEPR